MSGSGYWTGSGRDQSRGAGTGDICADVAGVCAITGARVTDPRAAVRNARLFSRLG